MSREFSPTSQEQYLQDALANLWAVHEIFGERTEPAIFGDQIEESCAIFSDQRSGNRISITPVPEDGGAQVLIEPAAGQLFLDSGNGVVELNQGRFVITRNMDVYVNDPTDRNGKWQKYPTGNLAFILDMPQIKPYPISDYDPRQSPPIVEGDKPDSFDPEAIYKFYEEKLEGDLLKLPSEELYTRLCGAIDERDLEDYSKVGESINREGLITTKLGTHLFQIEAYEIEPYSLPEEGVSFEREFLINYHTLNGDRVFVGFELGKKHTPENITLLTGNDFSFRLSREGLMIYGFKKGRKIGLIPHIESVSTLLEAFKSSEKL